MRNLIQGTALDILEEHDFDVRFCGQLTTPKSGYDVQRAVDLGMFWAADNGCFKRFEPMAIVEMLRKYAGVDNCLFVVAPDVLCNHVGTLELFWDWEATIASYGFPVAFVVQNGATVENTPFQFCDALFIGGDDEYKESDEVAAIILYAKSLGLYVHVGRVSTKRRMRHFGALGCDSFDSSGFSRWRSAMIRGTKDAYTNGYTKRLL